MLFNGNESTPKRWFSLEYQWVYLNYTWTSAHHYRWALESRCYIPENNAPVGFEVYENAVFVSVPRFRPGVPATLTVFDRNTASKLNPLLSPYPDWDSNDLSSCRNLQSVQSMKVDTRGVMWVIDGVRINNLTRCPPKLVLLDLRTGGELVHSYEFPSELSSAQGGFLNDLVIDERVGGSFAYITENSADPGVIVYSRKENRSWKLRDRSMLAEPRAVGFYVDGLLFNNSVPVDGIALSPKDHNGEKTLFYVALSSFTLYSLPTSVIRQEQSVFDGSWKQWVRPTATIPSQVDGIIMDNRANLYLTLLPLYGVARWDFRKPSRGFQIIQQDDTTTIWPDGFAFDQSGFLYVISNQVLRYIDSRQEVPVNSDIKFRVLRTFTGTNSYLYD
ncbi:hypothetical protein GWI33_007527 [Rhynchophorus ferrugineus]|uniref:Uncharacterized protein n=1 Tax=Rhynchophorus ferrugineus TaxID=354439 RepID=A0A834MI80_RHYFE|nr:hypothetical protein GWI33_007527 [Rhynchophorus ferrugineus]